MELLGGSHREQFGENWSFQHKLHAEQAHYQNMDLEALVVLQMKVRTKEPQLHCNNQQKSLVQTLKRQLNIRKEPVQLFIYYS